MRRLITGMVLAALVPAGATQAQGQYTGPLPFEAQWTVTVAGEESVVDLLFRNSSGLTQGGFWSVDGVHMERRAELGRCLDTCGLGHSFVDAVGSVDQRDLGVFGTEPLVARLDAWGWFEQNDASQPTALLFGPRGVSGGYVRRDNLGLLGCTIPRNSLIQPGGEPLGFAYAGRTCAADGDDGWIRTRTVFSTPLGGPLSAFDFTVDPVMTFVPAATVPTPATVPLLIAGLFAGLLCARRGARSVSSA